MNPYLGILIPLLGTAAGAFCVFFLRGEFHPKAEKGMLGFAAGIMLAASVWSLLLPAISRSEHLGRLAFLPAALGFGFGAAFLLAVDWVAEFLLEGVGQSSLTADNSQDRKKLDRRNRMLLLSVTLHNIPEGMAVGVAFAGTCAAGGAGTSGGLILAEAMALSVGIAIQNIPEGAIISLPLKGAGIGKRKAFLMGLLSGAVEPVAAGVTLMLAKLAESALPYLLAFAAGAMVLVVVEELIPEAERGKEKLMGTVGAMLGFLLMMILDVALG